MDPHQHHFLDQDGGYPCTRGRVFYASVALMIEDPLEPDHAIVPDLSGFVARMQVRKNNEAPIVIEMSTANGRARIDGARALTVIAVPAAITAGLPLGIYNYDLVIADEGGTVAKIVEGLFQVVDPKAAA